MPRRSARSKRARSRHRNRDGQFGVNRLHRMQLRSRSTQHPSDPPEEQHHPQERPQCRRQQHERPRIPQRRVDVPVHDDEPPREELDNLNPLFEVDSLLARADRDNAHHYLVLWNGYRLPTWEPAIHIAPGFIVQFERRHRHWLWPQL